jgi:peroxiredoxin
MKAISLALLLLFSSANFVYAQEEVKNYTEVGQEMPGFLIADLNDKHFNLSDHKGKVVYVFFWTTWCPYCRMEMPGIEKEIWQKYNKSEDFAMIAIAREETKQTVSAFIKKAEYSFPVAADATGEAFNLFANRGVPRSYLVDRNGKIIFQDVGYGPGGFGERKKLIDKELNKIKKEKAGK